VIIHDAITYMTTEADLKATFETAAIHLKPGGVFVVAPDYIAENFSGPNIRHDHVKSGDIDFVHVEYDYDSNPDDTKFESLMIYIINEKGKIRVEQDYHVLGLFPKATWQRLIEETGFKFEAKDYPVHDDVRQAFLFVGVLIK